MENNYNSFSKTNKYARYDNHNVASNVPDIFNAPKGFQIFHRDDIPNNTRGIDKFYCVFCHQELSITKATKVAPYFKHINGPCPVLSKIFDRPEQDRDNDAPRSKENIIKGYEIDIILYDKMYQCLKENSELNIPDSTSLIGNDNLWISGRFPYVKCYQKQLENELFPFIILENEQHQKIGVLMKSTYVDDGVRKEVVEKENISTIEINIISFRKSLLKFFNDRQISADLITQEMSDRISRAIKEICLNESDNKKWIFDKKLASFTKMQKREFDSRSLVGEDIDIKNDFWKALINKTNLGSDYIYIIPLEKTHWLFEKWNIINDKQFFYQLIQSTKYQVCIKDSMFKNEFNGEYDVDDDFNIENMKQKILLRFFEDCIVNAFCFNLYTIDEFQNIFNRIDKKYLYTFYTLYVRKKAFSFKVLKQTTKQIAIKEMLQMVDLINFSLQENEDSLDEFRFANQFVYYFNMIAFLDLYIESIKFRNEVFNKRQLQLLYKKIFWNKTDYIIKLCDVDKYIKYKFDILQIIPREQLLNPQLKAKLKSYLRKEVDNGKIKNSRTRKFVEYYYDKEFNDCLNYLSRDIGIQVDSYEKSYGNSYINKMNGFSAYDRQTKDANSNVKIEYINNKFRT